MEAKTIIKHLNRLLLDPNNYRFIDRPEYKPVSDEHIAEPRIQQRTAEFLKGRNNENISDLIDSFKTNGVLRQDPIQVRPLGDNYVVIEGNRRTATLKYLYEQFLQGMDVNTEDAIVTLSDKIWEIGSIDEIRQQVSDVTFTFHVVTNVIGNCQGDGWMSIVEYHADLLPYISSAMYEIGLDKVGEATKNIANIFPLDISVLSDSEFCKVVNFMKGHKTDLEELKKYSESEQEKMSEQYFDTIDKLDEIAEKLWYYGCPDNEGWGVVSRYLEKHLQDNFWK